MYNRIRNYHQHKAVYEKLSKLTGLRFKTLLKNSGIELKKILLLTDLIDSEENYTLILDKKTIHFSDKIEFIVKFHNYMIDSLASLKQEYKNLVEDDRDYLMFGGENAVYLKHEELGCHISKHESLIVKFREFYSKLKSNEEIESPYI